MYILMFESLSYRHVNLLHSPRANNCRIYLCKGGESSERHAQIIIQQELFNTQEMHGYPIDKIYIYTESINTW
jgi:hypothetical protein